MTELGGVWHPLRNHSPEVDWCRLENLVGTGMSDANGCLNGVDVWVENKLIHGNRIKFQPQQPAWIYRRVAHGGRVFILARKDGAMYLWHGVQVLRLVGPNPTVSKSGDIYADIRNIAPVLKLEEPFDWLLLLRALFGNDATQGLKPR